MSVLQAMQELQPQLSPAEKAELVRAAVLELGDAFPGIESTPGVCGGEPCIVRTRIPVWLLEAGRRAGLTDAALLGAYPTLRAEDLVTPGPMPGRTVRRWRSRFASTPRRTDMVRL